MDSPYGKLIGMMRTEGSYHNPSTLLVAKVESVEPFAIKVGDIIVDKDNILIADYLLKDYTRDIHLHNSTTTKTVTSDEITSLSHNPHSHSCTNGSISSSTVDTHSPHKHKLEDIEIMKATINTLDTVKVGDMLAVMPINSNQLYVILCKVVKL